MRTAPNSIKNFIASLGYLNASDVVFVIGNNSLDRNIMILTYVKIVRLVRRKKIF